ncbi:cell division FtsA domain-containing protein, partial [Sphingorhabdus sp.]|uniref:cell division FtsA domain-containing protein n=1 Tax=Sphingorhabdus sp. TaxID=1902408 RepID=UPI003BB05A6D
TGLATLNQGAADITDDIASVFGIRRAEAERLKCYYGSAISNPRDHQDVLDIAPNSEIGDSERPKITRAQLNAVICQRIDAMIAEIGKVLKDMGFTAPGRHHVVLTGGGAELKGLADHMQAALGRAVRIGRPKGVNALPDAHSGPAFSTLVGLALYANSKPLDLKLGLGINDRSGSWTSTGSLSRIWQLIKENF